VKQVGGELHSEDCQPVVVRVCDRIRTLAGSERSGFTHKNMEMYVVTADISQEDSKRGPCILYEELLHEWSSRETKGYSTQ
jgi:hypothetical protein